jgi:hypothetical protein
MYVLIPACLYWDALLGFCSQMAIGKKSALRGGPFSHFSYGLADIFPPATTPKTDSKTAKQVPEVIFSVSTPIQCSSQTVCLREKQNNSNAGWTQVRAGGSLRRFAKICRISLDKWAYQYYY